MSTAKISVFVSKFYDISEIFGQPKASGPKSRYQNLYQNRCFLSNLKGWKLLRNHKNAAA